MDPLIVGNLTIPRYGYITVEEDDLIADLLDAEQSPLVKAAQLADAVALAEGITILEAYKVIGDAIDGKALEPEAEAIRLRHAEAIHAATRALSAAGTARIRASVTAILRERCGMAGIPARWPRKHRDAVWQLVQEEQAAENMPVQPVTEELLGKPLPADGPQTPADGVTDSGS
jgi:hypothetical protein